MLDIEENLINIYKITNLKNNYIYVGSTSKSIQERFREHCKPSTWEKSPNSNFYKDIEKYGKESFEVELLDTCFERHRYIIEQYWWNKLFEEEYLMYDITMGVEFVNPQGAFYIFAKIPEKYGTDDMQFALDLAFKKKVGVTPGSAFGPGGEGYIRLSYASSDEALQVALKRIGEFLKEGNEE